MNIQGLNPCCNGIYLIIEKGDVFQVFGKGLNPCCNGIYLIIRELEMVVANGGKS